MVTNWNDQRIITNSNGEPIAAQMRTRVNQETLALSLNIPLDASANHCPGKRRHWKPVKEKISQEYY